MPKAQSLIGKPFGSGFVFADAPIFRSATGRPYRRSWVRCKCGNEYIVFNSNRDKPSSCGCVLKTFMRTHGQCVDHTHSKAYTAWSSMIQRCTNPNSAAYENWGGRGIDFLPAWAKFEPFFEFMGAGKKGWSIHRVDNDKGYFPENMVWALPQFQAWYTRSNKIITAFGITASLAELCARFKVSWHRTYNRLKRGWSPERALTEPHHGRIK